MYRWNARKPVVVFDLDGTLVDSAPGIAAALQSVGKADRDIDVVAVRRLVSLGAEALVQHGLNISEDEVGAALAAFREVYAQAPCVAGDIFPGAATALHWLKGQGIGVAVCTNKPQRLAELVLEKVGLIGTVDVVVGGAAGLPPKPAAAPIHRALEGFRTRTRALYIGDTETDALACSNAGVPFVFASFGYGELGRVVERIGILTKFSELPNVVEAFFCGAIATPTSKI